MEEGLKAKVVVTGASRGIGRCIAMRLASMGSEVGLLALNKEGLDSVAEEIRASSGSATAIPTDIRDAVAVKESMEQARKALGSIDILVNCAGVLECSPLVEGNVDAWRAMFEVNVLGTLNCIAAVLPDMQKVGAGHIINVSSVAGTRPKPGVVCYGASKAAVNMISGGLRLELAAFPGIRVTTIQPGIVRTEMARELGIERVNEMLEKEGVEGSLVVDNIADTVVYALKQPPNVDIPVLNIMPAVQRN